MAQRTVEAINARLKAAKIPVRIRQKGDALYLRASLPPKPGSIRTGNMQMDVTLGRAASHDGLKFAEAEAQRMGSLLALGRFTWEEWGLRVNSQKQTISELVETFRKYYLASNDISEDTWKRHWAAAFDLMPKTQELSERILIETLLTTLPNTWTRRQTTLKFQRLADWAKVEVNLSPYKGSYGLSQVQRRELPTDVEIVQYREAIAAPDWQWFFGIMATYGLRPYEPWFCQFEPDGFTLHVTIGKKTAKKTTPPRYVKPLYPDWVKRWKLTDIHRPAVNCKTHRVYSERCCHAFERFNIPFPPKTLRHCYAVRAAIVFRLSPDTAAEFMGHDVLVHTRTYKRWLTKAQKDWEYQRVITDPSLPPAP